VSVTAEIPKQDWARFLEDFSRRHQGWLVRIDDELPDKKTSPEGLPLEAVIRQLDGEADTLSVVVRQEGRPQGHLLHTISAPAALQIEDRESGQEKRLLVRSAEDRRTVVSLRRVVLPPV
jgi:hypothetical protein